MTRDELKESIRRGLLCKDYLTPSKNGKYNCPLCGSGTHKNKTGALKLHEDTNTFYCNSCNRSGDILDIIQAQHDCDFKEALRIGADLLHLQPDAPRPAPTKQPFNGNTAPTIRRENKMNQAEYEAKRNELIKWYGDKNNLQFVALYDYDNGRYKDGMTKVKYIDQDGEKTFLWVSIDPLTGDKFICGRKNCQNRLYTVGDPEGYTCIMTEGEKDAHTISRLYPDITAVSCMDGATTGANAGGKWKQEYSEQLTDKDVYIFCDNDDPGRNFSRIEALEANKTAHTVYVMDIAEIWHDCPEKGDITDMVNAIGADTARALISKHLETVEPFTTEPKERDYLDDFFDKIQTDAYKPFATGLPFFDGLLSGGIIPQSILLLMARPGTGKTAFCNQLALTMAEHKKPAVYLNLEMSREQMLSRTITARVNAKHPTQTPITTLDVLQGYQWDSYKRNAITDVVKEYRQNIHPYLKYENRGSDIIALKDLLDEYGEKATATGTQAPAIILDYVHLVTSSQKIETAELIKQVLITLKQYAIDYNTFVIGIIATNRASNEITLESGRDTSGIEYTGDYIISLDYENMPDKGSDNYNDELAKLQQADPRQMIFRVLKNRHGIVGRKASVNFDTRSMYFYQQQQANTTDQAEKPRKRL